MTGSISDILPGVLAAITGEGPDRLDLTARLAGARRVVVLLFDGLGSRVLPSAAPVAPVLEDIRAGRLGGMTEIACNFPSTTPASLVSLGTGALPGAHGVLGFRVNVPGTDEVLDHTQWRDEPDPGVWQPVRTRFESAGVSTAVLGPAAYEGSGLTVAAYRGAPYVPAGTGTLVDRVLASDARLVYGYHPRVDTAGHLFGVGSPEWLAEVATVDAMLGRLVDELPADTALVVTADHGMVNVTEEDRIDFDAVPELRSGVRVLAGEPRVRYVHTLPGAESDVLAAWRAVLGDTASVVSRSEAIDSGWFGPVPAAHRARIGDLVVTCLGCRVVIASDLEAGASDLVGYHGSVTPEEVGIPLIVVPPR
ncbi:nucleotide pyrophosphatase/phosphodiesterase family protein [Longispora sp. NPDC051575]|uniref:alkaline phosphatase family protein n=1 Tax=Longispora sp. NPDC051575 TaxID=3154943 RepID=UPI003444EF16